MKEYWAYSHSGFTLLEVLVVITIMGILAGISLPNYGKIVEKSRAVSIELELMQARITAEKILAEELDWEGLSPDDFEFHCELIKFNWKDGAEDKEHYIIFYEEELGSSGEYLYFDSEMNGILQGDISLFSTGQVV